MQTQLQTVALSPCPPPRSAGRCSIVCCLINYSAHAQQPTTDETSRPCVKPLCKFVCVSYNPGGFAAAAAVAAAAAAVREADAGVSILSSLPPRRLRVHSSVALLAT